MRRNVDAGGITGPGCAVMEIGAGDWKCEWESGMLGGSVVKLLESRLLG